MNKLFKFPTNKDNVVVYTKTDCPYCDFAKALLSDMNIWYDERTIQEYKDTYLVEKVTAPRIMINGELIGGWDELNKLYEES